MIIRSAEQKDIAGVLRLLSQVLELHAALRPDIFVPGTTKYTEQDLLEIFAADGRLTYVAVDEDDEVLGYAFCILREQPRSAFMVPFTSIYIDDLCVDSRVRGQHIGRALFDFVSREAKKRGCYELTLNVWEGNDAARSFYEKLGMKVKETQMEYILDRESVFESAGIRFVEVSEALIDDYLALINDYENVNRFIGGSQRTYTREDELRWVRKKLEDKTPVFSMLEKKSGRFIGNIEFMDRKASRAELGIAITAKMQDRGFGSEAVSAMTEYGASQLGLQSVCLRTRPTNARAIHVYEKCGFREYGRDDDTVYMEWRPRTPAL